jgi:hypothetical protein
MLDCHSHDDTSTTPSSRILLFIVKLGRLRLRLTLSTSDLLHLDLLRLLPVRRRGRCRVTIRGEGSF